MVVFICGPYSDCLKGRTLHNIRKARKVSEVLWSKGFANICPQSNSAFMEDIAPPSTFHKGYEEVLSLCHAIVLVDGWDKSHEGLIQKELAEKLGKPIYDSVNEFISASNRLGRGEFTQTA